MNENQQGYVLISGSLLALCVTSVLQLLQVKPLTRELIVSLWLFGGSIPILTIVSLVYNGSFLEKPASKYRRFQYAFFFSCLADFIGLCCIFFHLNTIAGWVFLVFSFLGFVFFISSPIKTP